MSHTHLRSGLYAAISSIRPRCTGGRVQIHKELAVWQADTVAAGVRRGLRQSSRCKGQRSKVTPVNHM